MSSTERCLAGPFTVGWRARAAGALEAFPGEVQLAFRQVHFGSAHDAALAEMNLGELTVGVGELQLEWTRRLGPTTSDSGERVFETIDHVDAHAVLQIGRASCRERV